MEDTSKIILVLAVAFLGLALWNLSEETIENKQEFTDGTIEVTDGDTFDFHSKNFTGTVRLLGVDTPEVNVQNNPDEFEGVPETRKGRECLRKWGERATDFVKNHTSGREFRLETDSESRNRGDYERLLAYLYSENSSESLNHLLVEKGYARVYESGFSKLNKFLELEQDAISSNKGIWQCRSL